jgi:uncharacterized NAD(P)/FAD-binding protein YdhS
MNGSFDVAIVGNGASGVATLIQLLKLGKILPSISICILGKTNSFGKGNAFSDTDNFLLMNTPANDLSVIAKEKDHFLKWFNENKGFSITGNYFPKRHDFAEYIAETAKDVISDTKNANVRIMNCTAIDVDYNGIEYNISTDSSLEIKSKYLVVATGNPPQESHYLCESDRNYIPDPYPVNVALNHIPDHSSIAILGCSLSAVDVAIYTRHKNPHTKIRMFSRKGLLPKVKGIIRKYQPTQCTQNKIHNLYIKNNKKKLSSYSITRIVRSEFKTNGIDWREALNFGTEDIHQSIQKAKRGCQLTDILMAIQFELDKSWRYIDESVVNWVTSNRINEILHNVAPIPMINAEKISEMIKEGTLEVISGIESVSTSDGLSIIASGKKYSADYIINATGPARNKTIKGNIFLKNIINKGLAKAHKLGGLEACPFTGSVKSNHTGIYSVGHPTFNNNPLINNIRLITHNAFDLSVSVISSLLDHYQYIDSNIEPPTQQLSSG